MTETLKTIKDILIQFTLSKAVFRGFNNKMLQGNKTSIMFESNHCFIRAYSVVI